MATTEESAQLIETASSTLALLQRCTDALIEKTNSSAPLTADPPDPLNVLHDAAKLLKAHTTKLSLLVINKPFTPSAIRKIITEVASTCVPAMMSAVEICRPEEYGTTLQDEMKYRVRRVFREYEGMMREVVVQTKEVHDVPSTKTKSENKRQAQDSLKSTGVVWEACDLLMELKNLGVMGVVVQKAETYRALLQDAIAELKEWGEGEDEGFSEPDYSDNEVDSMLWGSSKMPADRDDLKGTLDAGLKKLKLINTLFQALIKRRLKTLGGATPRHGVSGCLVSRINAGRADQLLRIMHRVPDETDELASAFYDLNDDEAKRILQQLCDSGREVIDLARINWDNKEDEFSSWSQKWLEAVGKL